MISSDKYVVSKLGDGERVVYRARLHWIIFAAPFLLIAIGGLSIPSKGLQGGVLMLIGLILVVLASVTYQNSALSLTNKRLLGKMGFPLTRTYDIDLTQIKLVNITQPAMGKLLDFGKITLICSSRSGAAFRLISQAITFHEQLREQLTRVHSPEDDVQSATNDSI